MEKSLPISNTQMSRINCEYLIGCGCVLWSKELEFNVMPKCTCYL